MVAYFVGDRPLEAIVVPVEPAPYTAATGSLVRPDGTWLPLDPELEEEGIVVELPTADASPFTVAGLYLVRLSLVRPADPATGTTAGAKRLDDLAIVVQSDGGWYSVGAARRVWEDAPGDDAELWRLLEISKSDVLAYAPKIAADATIPLAYREAQLMQSRNRWNALRVDPSGAMGGEGYSFTPYPLDWQIRQLLRPRDPRPAVA